MKTQRSLPRPTRSGSSLVRAGMLLALALLLPLVFHQFNLGGQVFLPMHIPILIGGFTLPWFFAGAVGFIAPLLSMLLTGMPPMPGALAMAFELATYGAVAALLYRLVINNAGGRLAALIGALLAGRVVAALANWLLLAVILGRTFSLVKFAYTVFVVAAPGIIIQLLLIPPLVAFIERSQTQRR